MNKLDFEGRVAVVTGGAQGIGLAVAQRLVASGARVCLWDVTNRHLDEARAVLGAAAQTIRVDVAERPRSGATRPRRPRKRRDASTSWCAPRASPGRTRRSSTIRWTRGSACSTSTCTALFLCNRAVVPIMRGSDYGRIVNIASVAGKEGNPNASAYSASKAAVIGLTKSLGKELASTGIRVNCVTPAAVRTAIFDQMTQQHIDFMLSKIPMGRFGTVEEIASLVCWLASEDCSFSTGAVFDISGGRATY